MRIIEPSEIDLVMAGEIPANIGIIMDGNRRWGYARDLGPESFHLGVVDSLISTLSAAISMGVPKVTLFALSVENLSRPGDEAKFLAQGSRWLWTPKFVEYLLRNRVNVSSRGESLQDYPELQVPESLHGTQSNRAPRLCAEFCLNYSGIQETLRRSRNIFGDMFMEIQPIDLCIRTAGEVRTSGFVPLDIMAAELVFTDTLWPDFRKLHMYSAVNEYQKRRRRFGR